jgi:hypothetical protein
LYGSVVDFLHDVVTDKTPQTVASSTSPTTAVNHQYHTQYGDLGDIKEQIDWLHFETIGHRSSQNKNILLMIGYKSGLYGC